MIRNFSKRELESQIFLLQTVHKHDRGLVQLLGHMADGTDATDTSQGSSTS